ncbi:Hypothetical glycosyl transferase [Mycobacteroides abscessus subsp. abscessus]|nr:Hypothetical glycosyl transferase [Mycobacteroides abscessus subsp. abscessus]
MHTAHTLAAVKNQTLAEGDRPEPALRGVGEQQVVDEAEKPTNWFRYTTRIRRASTSCIPAWTWTFSRRATRPLPVLNSGYGPMSRWLPLSGGSSP